MTLRQTLNPRRELLRHPELAAASRWAAERKCLSGSKGSASPRSQNELSVGIWYAVQPDYLKAMGIPLLRGRFISPDDNETTPSIVVIDENFAREFFPNEDPIGKQIDTDLMGPLLRSEIVGIVGHTKQTGPSDTATTRQRRSILFRYWSVAGRSSRSSPDLIVVARTSGSAAGVGGALRAASSSSILIRCSLTSNRWTN